MLVSLFDILLKLLSLGKSLASPFMGATTLIFFFSSFFDNFFVGYHMSVTRKILPTDDSSQLSEAVVISIHCERKIQINFYVIFDI